MKCGARVAGALATGYVLGRTKKMKFALMMGSWAAGQKFGSPIELLSKGTELLSKSPEFAKLNEEVRVKLLDAGKSAVAAAAAHRLSTLTDSIGSSAERLATGGPLREVRLPADDDSDGEDKPSRRSLLRFRRRGDSESTKVEEDEGRDEETDEETDEAAETDEVSPAEDGADEEAAEEEPAPAPKRRKAAAPRASNARKAPAQRASNGRKAPAERASNSRSGAGAARAAKPSNRGSKSAAARSGAK